MRPQLASGAATAILVLLATGVLAPRSIEAAPTVAVTTTADAGPGSLRAAIALANADQDVGAIRFEVAGAVQLHSDVAYTGSQPLTLEGGRDDDANTVIAGSPSAACGDALLVSSGGASLTLDHVSFTSSHCGGVHVAIPPTRTATVEVTLRNVGISDLGRDGLYIDDGDLATAGVALSVTSSTFERAGTTGDSAAIRVAESGGGGIQARLDTLEVRGSTDYGVRLTELGAGGIDVRTSAVTVEQNGAGDDIDEDGAINVLERGDGNLTGDFLDTMLRDNAGDGLEFFEEDAGDLTLRASMVTSLDNGIGAPDGTEGFEIDEAQEGRLDATLTDVTVDGNYFGIEFYEGGTDEDDPGDLTVRMSRVSAQANRSYGFVASEILGGNLDVHAVGLQVNRNGAHDNENGAYFRERGAGDLLLDLSDATFNANAEDGLFIAERADGDADIELTDIEASGQPGAGVHVREDLDDKPGDSGDLRLRLTRAALTDNATYGLYAAEVSAGNLDVAVASSAVTGNGTGVGALQYNAGNGGFALAATTFSGSLVDVSLVGVVQR